MIYDALPDLLLLLLDEFPDQRGALVAVHVGHVAVHKDYPVKLLVLKPVILELFEGLRS